MTSCIENGGTGRGVVLGQRRPPTGILVIDTETWEIVDRLEAPISEVSLSPNGRRLLGWGYRNQQTNDSSEEAESSGLYVIDSADLEVIAHHIDEGSSMCHRSSSFSTESNLAYVLSYGSQGKIDVIDLEAGSILRTRTGDQIQIFGDVGVLGDLNPVP